MILIIALLYGLGSCKTSQTNKNHCFKVAYAKQIPEIWKNAMISASINFQDGGNPIQYPNGAIWTFGDTFLKDGFRTNTLLNIDSTGAIKYLIDTIGTAKNMIPLQLPENMEEHRIWPAAGIYVNENLYVFYELVFLDDKELERNNVKNIGLVKSTKSWQEWERVEIEKKFPFSSPPHAIVECKENNRIYLYFVDKDKGLGSSVSIYSVNKKEIEDPSKYIKEKEAVVEKVYGQVSVTWNEYLKKYIMCHVGDLFNDARSIYLRTSESPVGPFSNPVKIYNKPGDIGEGFKGIFYCPYLHPELFKNEGEVIYVTYCVHENTFSNPYLIEVKISSTL